MVRHPFPPFRAGGWFASGFPLEKCVFSLNPWIDELFWAWFAALVQTSDPKTPISKEAIDALVEEHHGWAASIARSVARSWNMDWQGDGLDGAALEALLFCARRYDPTRGVPFKSYARRRIHEASTDAARRCRSWQKGVSPHAKPSQQQQARELSAQLLNIYPELRDGELPGDGSGGGDDDQRGSIRQMLMSATLLSAGSSGEDGFGEDALDAKRMVQTIEQLEIVHQEILWKLYWEGVSMRGLADEWKIDELNIVREHKALVAFLYSSLGKAKVTDPPKVRPGLKEVSQELRRKGSEAPFTKILREAAQ